jgi:hypothetical protein
VFLESFLYEPKKNVQGKEFFERMLSHASASAGLPEEELMSITNKSVYDDETLLYGETLLQRAAISIYNTWPMELLLKYGCHVNDGGKSQQTSLHIAADWRHPIMIEFLISIPPLNLNQKDQSRDLLFALFSTGKSIFRCSDDVRGRFERLSNLKCIWLLFNFFNKKDIDYFVNKNFFEKVKQHANTFECTYRKRIINLLQAKTSEDALMSVKECVKCILCGKWPEATITEMKKSKATITEMKKMMAKIRDSLALLVDKSSPASEALLLFQSFLNSKRITSEKKPALEKASASEVIHAKKTKVIHNAGESSACSNSQQLKRLPSEAFIKICEYWMEDKLEHRFIIQALRLLTEIVKAGRHKEKSLSSSCAIARP